MRGDTAKTKARRALFGLFVDAVRVMREADAAGLTHDDILAEWNTVAAASGLPAQLALPQEGPWGFQEGLLLGKATRAARERLGEGAP